MISYLLENISQILIFILLSYVTIFRREFSCNSTYHSNNNNNDNNSDSDTLEWKVQKKNFENDNDWMKENDIAAAATPSNATTESDSTILNNNNNIQHQHDSSLSSSSSTTTTTTTILKETTPFLFLNLNTDLQIHILTYLHPKDIINVTSCNKNIYQSFMNTNVDTIIWIRLWIRDYSWILHDWKIGNEALRRSLSSLLLLCKKDNIHGDRSSCSSCSHILEILQLIIVPKLSSSSSSSSSDQSLIDDINSMLALKNSKDNNDTISSSSPLPSSLQHETNHNNNNSNTIISMKEFYLTFSQIWINYTIAGHSTYNSCLTAIHGHIFNITNFLHIHPGSPESLILQGGGRDATTFFESVGHSLSARKMAVRELMEIVDLSCCSGYGDVGLYDHDEVDKCTSSSSLSSSSSAALSSSSLSNWPLTGLKSSLMKSDYTYDNLSLLPKHRSRPKRTMGTLFKIRQKIQIGEAQAKVKAEVIAQYLEENSHIVGDVNVYYDPFCCRWMGWYLDSNFDPVFIDELE